MRPLRFLCMLMVFVAPSLAFAGFPPLPSPENSTVPSCFSLVGSIGDVPAAAFGEFVVVVRDWARNPMAGVAVTIDLSSALDLNLCADQLDPAATVNCNGKTVRKVSAADGSVHFTVLGGSNGRGNAVTLPGGGRVYGNGFLIASPTVSAYDLDGSAGVGANDLSAWLNDFGSALPYGRSDYDCNGQIGANDLSLWFKAFGSGTMAQSCAISCP